MQTPKPAPKKLSAKLPARKAATASFAQEFAIIRRDVKNYLIDWAGQWEKFRDIVKNNN